MCVCVCVLLVWVCTAHSVGATGKCMYVPLLQRRNKTSKLGVGPSHYSSHPSPAPAPLPHSVGVLCPPLPRTEAVLLNCLHPPQRPSPLPCSAPLASQPTTQLQSHPQPPGCPRTELLPHRQTYRQRGHGTNKDPKD